MRKVLPTIIMSLLLVFLLSPVALAEYGTTLEVSGLSTVTAPPNIEVNSRQINGVQVYELLVKDNGIWRGSMLFHAAVFNAGSEQNAQALQAVIDNGWKSISEKTPSARLISRSDMSTFLIKDRKIYTANTKVVTNGFVANLDYYVFNHKGVRIALTLMCTDSDAAYWRPIYTKLISDGIQ